jgi:hypothetical protein
LRLTAISVCFLLGCACGAQNNNSAQLPRGANEIKTDHCGMLVPGTWPTEKKPNAAYANTQKVSVIVGEDPMNKTDWDAHKIKLLNMYRKSKLLEETDSLVRFEVRNDPRAPLFFYGAQFYEASGGQGFVCRTSIAIKRIEDVPSYRDAVLTFFRSLHALP